MHRSSPTRNPGPSHRLSWLPPRIVKRVSKLFTCLTTKRAFQSAYGSTNIRQTNFALAARTRAASSRLQEVTHPSRAHSILVIDSSSAQYAEAVIAKQRLCKAEYTAQDSGELDSASSAPPALSGKSWPPGAVPCAHIDEDAHMCRRADYRYRRRFRMRRLLERHHQR